MALAVDVADLGKRYRLGAGGGLPTLREAIASRLQARRGAPSPEREVWALREVSFQMQEGEVLGIIGRNGAGKSTLLKLLARITEPTTGRAAMRGRIGSLLEVGTGFHEELTGRENVFLNGAILGMRRGDIEQRFGDIVDFSGVERFMDVPIKRYSSGMKLRLAFAVAAHLEPEVVIVDEVLAVGDSEFQRRCLGKMSEIGTSGRTVLFVSHDLGAIAQLCPRALWIDAGRVRADGPAADVIGAYQDAFGAPESVQAFATRRFGPVELNAMGLLGPAGSPVGEVRRDEPFSVEMRFSTEEAVPGLDASIYIVNRRGVRVLDEALSEASELEMRLGRPGSYRAVLHVPPILAPGDYGVCVWLGTGRENFFDDQVLRFSVRPRPDDRKHAITKPRILVGATRWDLDGDLR